MKQLQPILWTKGTFLTPQHLQVQDRFLEDTLNFRLQALKFCGWGFSEILIDQEKLTAGNLVVTRASGIFPDGLLFDVPDADPAPPSKPLADLFDPGVNSLDVFLTVPDRRQRGMNVDVQRRDRSARYFAEVANFRDENTGSSEKPVQVARKNLRLMVEGEERQGTSALRMANVQKTAANTYRLNPRFVPPLLDLRASDYAMSLLRGIIEIMTARSTELSATRRQKNQSLADFGAADIANFWLLYTINAHFPDFSHLFEAKMAHPEELFSAMISLAGALTTFSFTIRARDLPLYNHNELGPVFTGLDEKIRLLMKTGVPPNVISLPLKLVRQAIYATPLEEEKYLVDTQMYLAISADASEDTIIKRVPEIVKVCSDSHIDHLVNQALPGIPLRHRSNPPGSIPVKLRYQYFSLNQSGPAWDAVRRSRNFAAYVPGDLPGPQMELIIILPQSS
jgi:type VI secretion system protein ImpJ